MAISSDGNGWDSESIVQAIRSPEAILVPVINLKNDGGYNDEGCAVGVNMHWKVLDHTVDEIDITIPTDFGAVVDMFEVQNGVIYNVTNAEVSKAILGKDWQGRRIIAAKVTLNSVKVSSKLATRLFVLANNHDVRQTVQNNLKD